MTKHFLPFLLLPFLLLGCATDDAEKDDKYVERPVTDLYNDAQDAMENENWPRAAKLFEEVDRQHPYSEWATRAQIQAAFAYYADMEYEKAQATLDRVLQVHPGNAQVDYAYYLRALTYYDQIYDVRRDQSITGLAEQTLKDVVQRFPNSDYARDAKLKLDLTQDLLAGKDMEVGRYYQKQELYPAAIGRFRNVIETYQTTSHTAEALHRLVECYLALGINSEAQAAGAVLGANFPGSQWYEDSYALLTGRGLTPDAGGSSWLGKIF
jgi:outer membrane protein assembly factor BamD